MKGAKIGRFPFHRTLRVRNQIEPKFSGMKFRNVGYTSQGCPNVPENWNNIKKFRSIRPFLQGVQFFGLRLTANRNVGLMKSAHSLTMLPIDISQINEAFIIKKKKVLQHFPHNILW